MISRHSISRKFQTLFTRVVSVSIALAMCLGMSLAVVPKASAALTPAARVSFTFDDGLNSALTQAAPTLQKYGFAATDYVISGCVGMTTVPNTCHANNSASYMTWAQIAQLKTTYGWEVGDHTATHPYLASADATDGQPNILTPAQVISEFTTSKAALAANGYTATDFASPYGDWTPPVLSQIAQHFASHRGFADSIDQTGPALVPDGVIDHGNTFPYNDYLIYDYQVQAGVTVAQVKAMIDQTKANNQWLVLTFHDIMPVASTNAADYQYNTADLDQIAAYVKSLSIPVVTMNSGLVTNAGNLLANSSFDTAISSNTADTTVWSTDDPTNIKRDTASNGNYPSPINSILFGSTTKDSSLFSPVVPVVPAKTYVLKNYLNIVSMSVAAGHQFAFYIDEYDASGALLPTRLMRTEVGNAGSTVGAWVESLNYEYKPSGTNVVKARQRIVVTANSATKAYVDNAQWFAEDGSTTGGVGAGGKVGDLNGDGLINITDLSILLSHWGQSGGVGNFDANPTININDLSILLAYWGK